MATANTPFSVTNFPPELVQSVAREAARDAERVEQFLRCLGIVASHKRESVYLPGWLLLGLGAGLRLLVWESNGTRDLIPFDLPPAQQTIRELFLTATEKPVELEVLARELTMRVFRVSVEQMAWHGRPMWDADLVLGDANEDLLVDTLARFLWENRHALDTTEGDQQ